jgi:hypothetical protein
MAAFDIRKRKSASAAFPMQSEFAENAQDQVRSVVRMCENEGNANARNINYSVLNMRITDWHLM